MTTGPIHTYGPSCLLAEDDPDLSAWLSSDKPPSVRPQFFYTSTLAIDDPLAALPPPTSGQGSGNEWAPLQPFSVRDNAALEDSWKQLQQTIRKELDAKYKSQSGTSSTRNSGIDVPGRGFSVDPGKLKQKGLHDTSLAGSQKSSAGAPSRSLDDQLPPSSQIRSRIEASKAGVNNKGSRERSRTLGSSLDGGPTAGTGVRRKLEPPFNDKFGSVETKANEVLTSDDAGADGAESTSPRSYPSRDVSISGSPFARAPVSPRHSPLGRSVESISSKDGNQDSLIDPPTQSVPKPSGLRTTIRQASPDEDDGETGEADPVEEPRHKVPVGASRLHLVELPSLKVSPITFINTVDHDSKRLNSDR